MGLEVASFIDGLVSANPAGGDGKSQGDDHIRLLKAVLKATFPLAIGARKFRDDTASAADTLSWTLYRNRNGVAADLAGSYVISGNDAGGNETVMARLQARWDDPVDGTEDTSILLRAMLAGVETTGATIDGNGINGPLGITTPAAVKGTTGIFSSTVTALASFISSNTSAILATTGAGTINFRPNGVGSSSGQISLASSGNTTINGVLTVTG